MSSPTRRPRQNRAFVLAWAMLFCLGGVAPAIAADDDEEPAPWYLEYMVGVHHVPNQTLRSTDAAPTLMGSTQAESVGFFFGAAVGRRIADHFRAELQLGYRSTELDSAGVREEPDATRDGTLSMFTAMVNGYADLDLSKHDIPLTPWIGLGLGWGMPRLDAESAPDANQFQVDDTASVFVYNAMVGTSIRLTPIASVNLGYRYLRTTDFEIGGRSGAAERRLDYEYDSHEGFLGLRFNF